MTRTDATPRRALALLAAMGLALAGVPSTALAITPIDGGPITLLPVPINTSSGDQYDPHVSGDLVSYTSADRIRFYDFVSGNDFELPPYAPGDEDLLSDVSNGRIVFSRIDESGVHVMVYDVGSGKRIEVDTQPSPLRFGSAIGSDTVAFIDLNASAEGELFVSDLLGATTRITNDARTDQAPQVAPLGGTVVYESCGTNCDIRQAAWNGTNWIVTNLTTTSDPEANPDTDGTVVAYDAVRSSERDIFWQSVGGGAEHVLTLSGEQRNPSISHGVIAFESIAFGDTAADIFVYDIATNRTFRITSTPADESLNDISVLSDGRVRVVWSSGTPGSRDVYGATFELPPVGPTYSFGGFLGPVDARPTLNSMKAGAAVPVKFSLGGDQGLDIFAAGSPRSEVIACDATADVDGIEQTVSAGGSSLTYDPTTDTYTYIWKTDRSWAGTCRQLVLGLADGSFQRANFKLK